MRWPLRYQILLPFALVLLVAIVAVSVLSAVLATNRARSQIEQQLQSIAATLSDSNFPLTDLVLRQMHGLSGAEFALTDLAGNIQAQSGAIRSTDLPTLNDADQLTQPRLGAPLTIGSDRFFPMVQYMQGRGSQPPGRLLILYPEHIWKEARTEAALPPLAVGGVALAATVLIAFLLAGRLTHPIVELRSQVNRIAQADYSPMPLPGRNDELRELAVDVNHMAQRLSDMESAVRRSERLTLLGQLAGGLAHNLRNNVTGALMAVQLHARRCDIDHESLDVVQRQLALTEENLKQFLAAPHGNPGFAPALSSVPCRLTDIIQTVVDLVDPSLRHRRVHLSVFERPISNPNRLSPHSLSPGERAGMRGQHNTLFSLPANSPAQPVDPPDLHADPNQLRQLLVNLVLNAADATGPTGWVRIETECPIKPKGCNPSDAEEMADQSIILRVLDNGPGPPPEIVKRLFEPFVTSKPEGVGLGLAVAQQIASSHGGSIVFHRTSGETCFEVHLPASNRQQPASSDISGTHNLVAQSLPTAH